MTDFRGNIDHWIRQAEPDYYVFFVKAWIPFNAWYIAELPNLNKRTLKLFKNYKTIQIVSLEYLLKIFYQIISLTQSASKAIWQNYTIYLKLNH
jgi:hypothetical protein